MRPEQLLEDLTEPQRQAVMHRDGPLLVLAGAGSGKTRVITRRVAYLAATGVRPQQILAITFTNKAADEMRQRIAALGAAGGATVGTFHWFCARLLRRYADRAGLQPNFSIFDQTDRLRAIRQAVSQCELASENWPPHRIEAIISNAKNAMLDPERFAEQRQEAEGRTIARIYRQYQTILAQNNALDFDDLLMCVARLLGQHQQLRDELEDRYLYVLVDEYQDTNNAQYVIAHRLTLRRQNICVTGDPDQSIYGWRGANLGNILEFERHYPQARVIRLEQNYRSTKRILRVAGRLISANVQRKQKQLWTHNDEGPKVQVWACDDAVDEARRVAAAIAEMHADGRPLSDFAIFYRINAMTRTLEEALRERALAYQIARGVEFYSRKEIKDALAYLRVMVNPADEVSLLRIINTPPRGIGKTTVERLRAHAGQTGRGLLEIIRCSGQIATLRTASGRLKSFLELLEGLMGLTSGRSVQEVLQQVLERTGLERAVIDREGPDSDAAANLAELVTAAADYDAQHADGSGSLQDWLAQVSL
ncbi:MAG: ATP-dependent helicase, partial [Phycisphaerae bacterium]